MLFEGLQFCRFVGGLGHFVRFLLCSCFSGVLSVLGCLGLFVKFLLGSRAVTFFLGLPGLGMLFVEALKSTSPAQIPVYAVTFGLSF